MVITNQPLTFSSLEKAKLQEFRARIQVVYPECDEKLIKWLRARELDVRKAEQMLRRHLVWRSHNELERLLEWRSPKVYIPYIYLGNDYTNAPVYLIPIGHFEFREAIESGDVLPCLRFVYQAIERMLSISDEKGSYEGVIILDMEGFRYQQLASRSVIQGVIEMLRIFESNYPELLKAAIIINAPKTTNLLLTIAKPFLHSNTLSKLEFYGSERSKWVDALLKLMPADILPPFWGGTKKGADEYCSDDWFQEPLPLYFMRKLYSVFDAYGQEWLTLKIDAGECLPFEYTVAEVMDTKRGQVEVEANNNVLNWAFYTEGYDLGFSLLYEDENEYLIENKRVNSHKVKQIGSKLLTKPGKYVLKLDNSFSRSRSKIVHYAISLTSSECPYLDPDSASQDFVNNQIANHVEVIEPLMKSVVRI